MRKWRPMLRRPRERSGTWAAMPRRLGRKPLTRNRKPGKSQSLSITAKIWLSVGIFILGFVISTVLDQVHGLTTENDLRRASDDLLPAVQLTQEADMAFQKMVKSFSVAVLTQDTSLLNEAAAPQPNPTEAPPRHATT